MKKKSPIALYNWPDPATTAQDFNHCCILLATDPLVLVDSKPLLSRVKVIWGIQRLQYKVRVLTFICSYSEAFTLKDAIIIFLRS